MVYLFDLFHTLVTFEPGGDAHKSTFLNLTQAQWDRCVLGSDIYLGYVTEPIEILRSILQMQGEGKPVSEETLEKLCRHRIARVRDIITQVRPEILQTLRELKRRGHQLCLVSNADCIDTLHWAESPLAPLFDETIFSCQVHVKKPDPAIYLLAAQKMNCSPQSCIFIGDGGSDELAGAKRAGMRTVQARHFLRREDLGADYIADRFEDVLNF